MSEIIKLNFIRPVKVQKVVDQVAGEVTINEINREGGEFGVERKKGKPKSKHKGLDFLSYLWEVGASEAGIVAYSGFRKGSPDKSNYGHTVIIEHTSKAGEYDKYVYTLYAHLSKRSVVEGIKIKQGDEIGKSGNSGMKQRYIFEKTGEYPKVWNKEIKKMLPDRRYHLHFEVIVSPKKITWDWKKDVPNELRINPETALAEGVEVKYQEPERQVTDADRKKFAERLRIKEKRNARGRLVSHDVWVNNKHVGRLDNRTKEIKLSIPMSKFFALVDGPKPMKRHGEADFDVKLNA